MDTWGSLGIDQPLNWNNDQSSNEIPVRIPRFTGSIPLIRPPAASLTMIPCIEPELPTQHVQYSYFVLNKICYIWINSYSDKDVFSKVENAK